MKLTFLGQQFANEKDFERAYPAYGRYSRLVAKGADTPHKIEVELHRKQQTSKRGPRFGAVQKAMKTA